MASHRPAGRQRPGVLGWLAHLVAAGVALPLDLALLALVGATLFVQAALSELPDMAGLRTVQYEEPLRVYSADGSLMGEFGIERSQPVEYADIPSRLIEAFLAAEDSRFFAHEGIDWVGLARATVEVARSGSPTQGGSTITMQLTRNLFLTPEKTLKRKVTELLLALRVEETLTKREILELYLNKIFFGHRAYGISAAAELYYGKGLEALTLPEMAMLAGIPKSPSMGNPITSPERARARRDYVLRRMLELGYIDEDTHREAASTPDTARLHRPPVDLAAGYVAEMARGELADRYGDEVYRMGLHVYTTVDARLQREAQAAVRAGLLAYDKRHGYRGAEAKHAIRGASQADWDRLLEAVPSLPELRAGILVSVSPKTAKVYLGDGAFADLSLRDIQWARPYRTQDSRGRVPQRLGDILAVGDLIRVRPKADGTWSLAQVPQVAGALATLAPENGAILALVGGYDFGDSAFNRAVDARRQPGSSFKPFLYAAALDRGWTPASLVRDEAIRVPQSRGRVWAPKNADGKTMGPIRLRVALAKSRNLATIDLLQRLGIEEARAFLPRFGFAPESLPRGLSLALGAGAASPLQMAAGYAVFANGGYRVMPHLIQRIQDSKGRVLFEANPPRACSDCWYRYGEAPARTRPLGAAPVVAAEQVLDPRIAFQMTSLLRDVIDEGTGQRAKQLKRGDVVGKTGTTNALRDSWFCGYQKDVVTVVWMGFDGFTPLGKGEEGGRAALGIWVDFMTEALKDKPEAVLDPPVGLVKVRFDRRTGAETTAEGPQTIEEWIAEEFRPILLGIDAPPDTGSPPRASGPPPISDLIETLF